MPDHIGWGKSSKPAGQRLDFDLFAETTKLWLDAMHVERCSIVGNSMGGGIALTLTLDYPSLVDKLVLLGPAGLTPRETFSQMPGVQKFRKLTDSLAPDIVTEDGIASALELMTHDRANIDPVDVAQRIEVARSQSKDLYANLELTPFADRLRQIDHEMLVFWGVDDTLIPIESSYVLMKRSPNARLIAFSSCAHLVHVERVDAFNNLTAQFLRQGWKGQS
jgi:4,5:9,10-diseco-3-hydroxy-5,9,17-trioxoandrosta-1(10),2-diene-4-oate hydrolase